MEHDLVVEGLVVSPRGVGEAQVGISDGVIREVRRQGLKGVRTIRAGRCLVFPGFIDCHVHMREPGWEYKEDFATGTAAAAHGGVTTVVDMPNNPRPTTTVEAAQDKQRLVRAKALVEVLLNGGVKGDKIADLAKISALVTGYKLYLARSTGDVLFPTRRLAEALKAVAAERKPLSVHCEDQSVIDAQTRRLEGESRPDLHCDIRPPRAEVSAVETVVAALSRSPKTKVNVCHASTSGTLSLVGSARRGGYTVSCEATLHHIYFNRKAMEKDRRLKTNPPLRAEDDRLAVLRGLHDGAVDFLVTDHAPHTAEEKLGDGPSGVPGLDDYGHIVSWLLGPQGFDPGVLARVTSANAASFYGLFDRGEVAVGKRADLAVIDQKSPERVTARTVWSKCGWSPYEGVEFPGKARWTIVGGEVRLDDCALVA